MALVPAGATLASDQAINAATALPTHFQSSIRNSFALTMTCLVYWLFSSQSTVQELDSSPTATNSLEPEMLSFFQSIYHNYAHIPRAIRELSAKYSEELIYLDTYTLYLSLLSSPVLQEFWTIGHDFFCVLSGCFRKINKSPDERSKSW